MPWAGGVYTRGYPSWSNDAASNLPISATKFDLEDNDFATGLNNCLTKDGLNVPTGTLNWSQTASIVANFSRASDGTIFRLSRTAGANNPTLDFVNADATGMSLSANAGGLSLAVGGTGILAILTSKELQINAQSGNRAVDLLTATYAFGNATDNPAFNFQGTGTLTVTGAVIAATLAVTGATVPANGLYLSAANTLALATNTVQRATIGPTGAWTIIAPTAAVNTLTIATAANGDAIHINANATAGQSFGITCNAGTNASDYSARFNSQAGTAQVLIQGDGSTFVLVPTAAGAGPANSFQVGYADAPPNVQNGNYTLALTDRGKSINRTGGTGPFTWTIPANASIAFPIGTVVLLNVFPGVTGVQNVAITTDTLHWMPTNTTGARVLATTGAAATLFKITTTDWFITGVGIT